MAEFYKKSTLADLFGTNAQIITRGYQSLEIDNPYVKGQLLYAQYDGFTVCYQNWEVTSPFKLQVDYAGKRMLKLQLEMEGGSHFEADHRQTSIHIPAYHHQFIAFDELSGELTYTSPRRCVDIHLDLAFLKTLLASQGVSAKTVDQLFNDSKYKLFQQAIPISMEQLSLLEDLIQHPYLGEFARDYIRSKTIELILTVFNWVGDSLPHLGRKESDLKILQQVKLYIDGHYENTFRMEDLCRMFGINAFKLKKGFKEVFGCPVFVYVRTKRLQKAYALVTESCLPLKEIAFLSGYKYAHHFTQAFYAQYGVLPSALRQKREDFGIQSTSGYTLKRTC